VPGPEPQRIDWDAGLTDTAGAGTIVMGMAATFPHQSVPVIETWVMLVTEGKVMVIDVAEVVTDPGAELQDKLQPTGEQPSSGNVK
jgi:hypothetical protein